MDGEERLGHLDLHFAANEVFGTLVLDREMQEIEITQLIERIDEDVVLSAEVRRDDFLMRVYVGREVSLYSDELLQTDYIADGDEPAADS